MKNSPAYTLSGRVVHRRGIGKYVGTPTADLELDPGQQLPPSGVYPSQIFIKTALYSGVAAVGTRPTLCRDLHPSAEVYILDFEGNLYGLHVSLVLYPSIREIRKFDNLTQLLLQIQKDCMEARRFFNLPLQSFPVLRLERTLHRVSLGRQDIRLSPKEFELLSLLWHSPGQTFSKEEIYCTVWRQPSNHHFHAVENTIFQIRRKLRPYAGGREWIETVAGYGYRLASDSFMRENCPTTEKTGGGPISEPTRLR